MVGGTAEAVKKAQQNSFDLLVNCILKRGLLNETTEQLLSDIGEAFQLPFSVEPAHKRTILKRDENGAPISKTRRRSLRNPQEQDFHREECEVCDKGGDLLCCDSCSLVYHLQCVRYRIESIPDGEWFCPYCLHSKIGDQSTRVALRQMKLIQQICRVSNLSPTEESFYSASEGTNKEFFGLPSLLDDNLVVSRGAGRFVVKRISRNATASAQQEVSRHWTFEEALQKIKNLSTLEKKRYDETEDLGMKSVNSEDGVWCSQCLDDPRILCCCFCGCKVCFGKFDPTSLVRCDGCEGEYHTYCLDPPLEKPSDGPWFCAYCLENPHLQQSVLLELEREKSGGTTSSSDAGDNQPARRGRGRPPGSSRLRPKSLLKEREKSLGSRSKPSEETKKVSKSVKLEVTFNPSTSDVPSLTIDPLLSPQLAESLGRKGKDLRYNSAENIDTPDSTKPTTSASKRRVSSSSVHAQHQPAFAPMNLENTLESFQYILDKGGVRHQLSLRETARIDVATTQYNIFKEWASKSELKQLVAELILCRSDLLERMKSSDSNRFSQLDQSKYSSSVAKKRKFGDSESCAGDSSSAEGDHSWDFSDEHDSDGEGSYPSGNYSIVDYPPSRPLFSASSLTDGRQFSSRFVKSEDPSLSNSNRGIPKSHLNDIPRKYVNDKSATPRYNPSGTSHTASSQAAEATPLSRSLTGSSSNSSKATKYKGSLMQTDKQRQQRYSHPKQVTSTLHRVPVPTLAQRPPRAAPTTTPQLPVNPGAGGSGAATAQSLEDYIRFSMLVSLSQQDVSTQTPLAAPLPPPAEVDTRHHAHGPSFGPHEGLLLSSGNTTANAGLVPMTVQQRSSVILPSPSGISTVSQTASPQASKVTAPSPHSLSAAGK